MPTENLTDSRVRGLKHADGEVIDLKSGAIARADREGRVSFSFRYRSGGTRRRIVLGRYPGLTLAAARIEVGRIRELVRTGSDPQADRRNSRTAPAAMTFNELADLYIERYARRAKSSWRKDQQMLSLDVRPAWGVRPAASITRADAAKLLFDVAARAPVAANRLRSILSKLFTWSVDSALLDDNPMLGTRSPTREGRGKSRTLNDQEIKVLWRALDTRDVRPEIVAALRILLLTGQRSGEVMGMVMGELHHLDDARAACWELPATRTKSRRSHVIPLAQMARQLVLAELAKPRASEFVFGGRSARRMGRNSLSMALSRVIGSLGDDGASLKADPVTPHDLRRSVATGLSKLGVVRDDRLAVLAHSHGDVHGTHYDKYDRLREKRLALEKWERRVRTVIAGEPIGGAEVVTLRSAVTP